MANESAALEALAADLRVAAFRLTRRLRIESHLDEISDSQLSVLLHLYRVGPRTPGQIAEFERVSAPSTNRTINGLVEAGCVRRVDDPDDGRRVIVELTHRGAELAQTVHRQRNEWLATQLAPLARHDREALARAVELIEAMVQR